jgi:endonuclease-8
MPEGDTVFRVARRLNGALVGEVLTGCDVRVPEYATVDLTGERVENVVSCGKHILMRVGAFTIHSHLKMEGDWHLYRPDAKWRRPAFQARIVLSTTEHVAVGFELGMLDIVPTSAELTLVGHLGPDLLGADDLGTAEPGTTELGTTEKWPRWDAADAVRRISQHPDVPIAVALLDQRNLAGLGNEYVAELCFLRGMLPTRPVRDVDVPRAVALAHRLITANRDRVQRSTTGDLRPGRMSWVYGRSGKPCLRCGTRIRSGELGRTELESRVTFFCEHCQS